MKLLNPMAYGPLLAAEQPQAIRNGKEFEEMAARLEALDFSKRKLSPEEAALRELLAALIQSYEGEHHQLPEAKPHEMVQFLMDQRGLRQADLVPVLGSRLQVSELVNGKRATSKAQMKRLVDYFAVASEHFLLEANQRTRNRTRNIHEQRYRSDILVNNNIP